ncbi:MAG: hypothetical protein AAF704_06605 [Cyanobacteria bacterium P01_D01_bin.123]
MLSYFRDRHPLGSILTDLLRVEEGIYVVKAQIVASGIVLGTGMAGSTTVEEAEDAAISRAQRVAGYDAAQLARVSGEFQRNIIPALSLSTAAPNGHTVTNGTSAPLAADSFGSDGPTADWSPPVDPEPPSDSAPAASQTTLLEIEPEDLSDIIAQSDVELKRIGWGPKEGRKYLESTFEKRSRQQLDEKELRKFLAHLKKQPTRLVVEAEEAF